MTWLEPTFMRYALLAVLLMSPLYGLMGTMVVQNRMAFFSESLGHSALAGIGIGLLLGLGNPLVAMVGFGLAFALLIVLLQQKSRSSTDTLISVFSSTAMALGVVLLGLNGGLAKYTSFLTGDILSVTPSDLIYLAIALTLTVVYWCFFYNKLLLYSLNPALSHSRGRNGLWLQASFCMLVAVVVMLSIRWVGTLLLNAMLILPTACARNLARNSRQLHLFSVVLATVLGVAGLIASFYLGTASGATIVLLLALAFFATLPLSHKGG